MSEAKQDTAPMRDGETTDGRCQACKTETTMRFRIKSSWFGMKKKSFWACTRCGNMQDDRT